jgi:hypothetical protein
MQAPICKVAGMVVSTEIREEPGLGMSSGETFIYTDIILNISESIVKRLWGNRPTNYKVVPKNQKLVSVSHSKLNIWPTEISEAVIGCTILKQLMENFAHKFIILPPTFGNV